MAHHPSVKSPAAPPALLSPLAAALLLAQGCTGDSEPAGEAREAPPAPERPAPDPALSALETFLAAHPCDTSKSGWRTRLPKPPKLSFDPEKSYFWNLTTNKGPIKIKLFPHVAPMHASSTMYLTRTGFYDGLTFHRVIPDFMAQGGCPLGTGTGGPGYEYDGELDPQVKHDRPGLLSMANRGPGTDGSQFFITFKATPWLDGKHTIFGEVVAGMEAVRELEKAGTAPTGRTRERLVIEKAEITTE